jgi:hypothetical protein
MPGKKLTDDLILTDGDITDVILKLITDSFKLNAQITKDTARKLSDNLKLSDLILNLAGKLLSDSLKLTSITSFDISRNLSDSIILTDTYDRIWVLARTYSDNLVLTDIYNSNLRTLFTETMKLSATFFGGFYFAEDLLENIKLDDDYFRVSLAPILILMTSGSGARSG